MNDINNNQPQRWFMFAPGTNVTPELIEAARKLLTDAVPSESAKVGAWLPRQRDLYLAEKLDQALKQLGATWALPARFADVPPMTAAQLDSFVSCTAEFTRDVGQRMAKLPGATEPFREWVGSRVDERKAKAMEAGDE